MDDVITIPGFVDLHVHLREPGTNTSETIANGSRAALLGGFAKICDMPNNPGNPTWTAAAMAEKINLRDQGAYNLVAFNAGAQPEANNLDELPAMAKQASGLKLYGSPNVSNYQDYKIRDFQAIVQRWHTLAPTKPIFFHRGDSELGEMIELVAGKTGHKLHICHINSPNEVTQVMQAKKSGLAVTCGVCPHHLFKTSHDTKSQSWFARMLPPLVRQDEAEELWSMLVDGHIDAIETDYAPHAKSAKWKAILENPAGVHGRDRSTCYGVTGIEHVIPILLQQVRQGNITLERLIAAGSTAPQEILGVRLPPKTEFTWRMEDFRIENETADIQSGAGWTPYLGFLGTGRLEHATIGGQVVVKDGVAQRIPGLND